MSNEASGRGFQGRCAGVRCELRVGAEPSTWAEYASEGAGGEEVDATQPSQRLEPGADPTLDSRRQFGSLIDSELKALSQPADGGSTFHL
jgi:hypothetical protein